MKDFMKKQGAAFYLNVLAGVLNIAGLIAMIICSTMTSAYALNSLGRLIVEAVIGFVLILLAIYSPNRFGNHDYISTASVITVIALLTKVIGGMITERILLVSGLFSFNAGNMLGWSVFYATVAAMGCFLIAIVCLIAGAFTTSVREIS